MTESRAVWKDLRSKRIGKSLEGVRVRDDVKGHGFLMVYTCIAEIKEYDVRAHVYNMVVLWWMSNRT